MTRWVRAGNTQKHKKVPGDATKWGEFDHQKTKSSSKIQKNIKSEPNSEESNKSQCVTSNFRKCENLDSVKNREQFQCSDETINVPDLSLKIASGEQTLVSRKNRKGKKKNVINDSKNLSTNDKQTENSGKVFEKKKEMYLKKLQEKRAKKGIMLLPSKVERKLYIIKKKLREKGLPPNVLKDIIRKERRKEELKFRKTFNPSKLCFNCRQPGHVLADCPKNLGPSNQETGMCFKCGSNEHTSFRCHKKVQGFPFATCFICKEQGHISKDCPKNKHGIYPKGGKCKLCGNVNHLKKDCPSLIKKETNESAITLHTINEATSIDEEMIEKKKVKKECKKKPKIVKF